MLLSPNQKFTKYFTNFSLRKLESGLKSFEEQNPGNNLVSEKTQIRHCGAPFLIGDHTVSLIRALRKT